MRILLVSYNDLSKDGRLMETVKICKMMGEVFTVTVSDHKPTNIGDNDAVFSTAQKFGYGKFVRFVCYNVKRWGFFDLIVADNRTVLPVVYLIKKHARNLWYDARELYILHEVEHFRGKVGCILEKLLIRKFNIVTSANMFRSRIMKKYYNLDEEPIVYENIRRLQCTDAELKVSDKKLSGCFKKERKYLISTSGVLLDRDVEKLAEAVTDIGEKVHLFIVGYSSREGKQRIQEIQSSRGMNNITIMEWLTKPDLKYMIDHCDIGIVNYSMEGTNNTYCASGKLYEFFFEGIPVVTTENPPLKYMCDNYHVGISDGNFKSGILSVLQNLDYYKEQVKKVALNADVDQNDVMVMNQILQRLHENIVVDK